MSDQLLTSQDREEQLSEVYVHAVATAAGYTVAKRNLDRDGVDLQIQAGGGMRPCLDIQLKGTINLGDAQDGSFRFPLKRRNYDLLRLETIVPRILVVLQLPQDERDWVSCSSDQLILRRCAWWTSLLGEPETMNTESVTISIPGSRSFNVDGLKELMVGARRGRVG